MKAVVVRYGRDGRRGLRYGHAGSPGEKRSRHDGSSGWIIGVGLTG